MAGRGALCSAGSVPSGQGALALCWFSSIRTRCSVLCWFSSIRTRCSVVLLVQFHQDEVLCGSLLVQFYQDELLCGSAGSVPSGRGALWLCWFSSIRTRCSVALLVQFHQDEVLCGSLLVQFHPLSTCLFFR
ncbi:hypothetical protein ACOMHN_064959 [Nucella lapillus]